MSQDWRIGELERRLEDQRRQVASLSSRLAAAEQAQAQSGGMATPATGGAARYYIGKATTSITARSGTTPGSGTVEIYDGGSGTLTATGATKTAKNAGTIISSGKWVRIDLDGFGVWWADPQECE